MLRVFQRPIFCGLDRQVDRETRSHRSVQALTLLERNKVFLSRLLRRRAPAQSSAASAYTRPTQELVRASFQEVRSASPDYPSRFDAIERKETNVIVPDLTPNQRTG